MVREREGRTRPAVSKSESAAVGFLTSRVAKGTAIVADEASSWNDLQARCAMSRIDNQAAYSDRASTRMGLKASSRGCAGQRSGIIITWPGRIWSATRTRLPGASTSGGRIMAGWFRGLWGWR